MYKRMIPALAAAVLALTLNGCGDDQEIPVSEYAPKQADFDKMREAMDKSAKIGKPKKSADKTDKAAKSG